MTTQDIAAALQRAEAVFRRRPDMGLHDDAPASARWQGGMRMVASHANGTQMQTDMPGELGGTGDQVSPGWLFRAGIASCSATSIVMAAAASGIELDALEVNVSSRSDTRALLGIADTDGKPVYAGPRDVQLKVRIAARGVAADRLRTLVEGAVCRSPIPSALPSATPFELSVDIDAS
jgi:uncharacterized OsmC-like protein